MNDYKNLRCKNNYVPIANRYIWNINNPEAQKMQQMAADAEKLETWDEQSGDDAQKAINDQCDTAIKEHGDATDKAMQEVEKKYQELIDKELAAEKPQPKNHNSAEWKKWKEEHDVIWSKIKNLQNETATKKGELVKEHESVRTQLYELRDTAIHKMRAAFEARRQNEEALKRSLENIGQDHQDVQDAIAAARFAANLADDGTLSSWSGEVQDYLNSEIGGRKLNDSELEDITQGIVATLHNGNKNDPENPAKKFMAGLSDREANSGEFWSTDDRGVRARDVQLQILQNLGYDLIDRDERADAVDSDAGKLVEEIAKNKELSPQLRGMLLGRLASAEPKDRDAMVDRVNQMFAMAKEAEKASKTIDGSQKIEGAMIGVGAIPAILLAGPTAGLSVAAWGSLFQGARDRAKLERSGLAFIALEDAQKVTEFNSLRAKYEAAKRISGISDPKIEQMLNEAKTPARMRKAVKSGALDLALAQYKSHLNKEKVAKKSEEKKKNEQPKSAKKEDNSEQPTDDSTAPTRKRSGTPPSTGAARSGSASRGAPRSSPNGGGNSGELGNSPSRSPEASSKVEVKPSTDEELRNKYGATVSPEYNVENPPDWVKNAETQKPTGRLQLAYYEVKSPTDAYGVIVNSDGKKFVYKKKEA